MNTPRTSIRLVEPDDAEALAAHLGRDAEAFARWDPERPGGRCCTRAVSLAVEMMTTELELHRAEAITQMDNLGS